MTCAEILDLLPGYILDALDDHEMDEVDAHLAGCREHDDELVDLRTTGMALALLDDDAPSAQLRNRIRAVPGPMPLYAFAAFQIVGIALILLARPPKHPSATT